tara:strand:+ start:518 stop:715 length:198 start_codon:yes stop_codon:yes gene_type:complete
MAKHSDRHIMRQQKKVDKQLRHRHVKKQSVTPNMIPLNQTITLDHLTNPKLAPGGGFEPPRSPKQ